MSETTYTAKKAKAFLDALADTCNVTKSCEIANIPRISAYNWRNHIPEFAAAWEEAKKVGVERLEDEATRRATEGDEDVRYDKDGNIIGVTRKYSDTLLIFLLKGAKPDKYRERVSSEISGPGGKPIQIDDKTAAEKLQAILGAAQARFDSGEDLA